ncbi:hypothetical protein E2C01_080674 [Portunus trituberculatus]|uniref:Uncharacterized protein n=1 Tax=Portunus trituberculatus TaxID=210409 RepID=A0A5B7ITU8_PORTR|nr:hypothetical protein [Portunus trituberculatus]
MYGREQSKHFSPLWAESGKSGIPPSRLPSRGRPSRQAGTVLHATSSQPPVFLSLPDSPPVTPPRLRLQQSVWTAPNTTQKRKPSEFDRRVAWGTYLLQLGMLAGA